jgi:Smg protein
VVVFSDARLHEPPRRATATACNESPQNHVTSAREAMAPDDDFRDAVPPLARRALGYSGLIMFEVLVYLYENYGRPDACPDHVQLTRKLSAVGFESEEIEDALSWLDGLADVAQGQSTPQRDGSVRVYTDTERERIGDESLGFITFLESAGVLGAVQRELVIDRACAVGGHPIDLEDLKVIVLMVFWSLGEEPDALILDELFVAPEDRLVH